MQFTWDYEKDHSQQVKYFFKRKRDLKGSVSENKISRRSNQS